MNRPPIPEDRIEVYADRAAWLAARKGRVGGSDVAKILGVSPFGGPWDVWGAARGLVQQEEPVMVRGRRWERVVLQEYAHETGLHVSTPPAIWGGEQVIVRGPEPWMVASPDAFAWQDSGWGGVEAKTAAHYEGWGDAQPIPMWEPSAAQVVPPHYALQCYWYLACTGLAWWDLAVLLPYYDLRWYRLYADHATHALLVEQVGEWRERHLVRGEPPEVDGSEACGAALATLPGGQGSRVASEPEAAAMYHLSNCRALRLEAEKTEAALRNQLCAAMGNHDALEAPGLRCVRTAAGVRLQERRR